MAGMLRVSRSRGAMSGVLLVLLGLWGGLIPLVGPYVHYAYTPNHVWTMTSGRVWLEILPAAGTLLGGLILLMSKVRPSALLGASLAAASGGWFVIGTALARLWTSNVPAQGLPVGGHIARVLEQIGFFGGLGIVIVCIASVAIGRLSLVSVRDARTVERSGSVAADATARTADGDSAATSRSPARRMASMRRVASSGRHESATQVQDSGETVAATSSQR